MDFISRYPEVNYNKAWLYWVIQCWILEVLASHSGSINNLGQQYLFFFYFGLALNTWAGADLWAIYTVCHGWVIFATHHFILPILLLSLSRKLVVGDRGAQTVNSSTLSRIVTRSGSVCLIGSWKKKVGANAMKRVAAGAHLPTPWLFEPAKRPDRADYCLG